MGRCVIFKDLACYQRASEAERNHKLIFPDRFFDLEKLPTDGIRNEMEQFLHDRGQTLTMLSMRSDFYPYHQLCSFLSDTNPALVSFIGIDYATLERSCRTWLLKNGKPISIMQFKGSTGQKTAVDADLLSYIRKIYFYFNPKKPAFDFEVDRWLLSAMPIKIRQNLTKYVKSISFTTISQNTLKQETKKVIYLHLSQKALGTVLAELTAMKRFSSFLADQDPAVDSLLVIDRELLESYLVYLNTQAATRKSYAKDLCHLKAMFITAGKVYENKELEQLFYVDDIGKSPALLYKTYSDTELKRLNAAILDRDEQIARVLLLHQLLGTRISETLSLKQNSVYQGNAGKWMIKIEQIKSHKSYAKPINEDIKALYESACRYTKEHYGDREYIFVTDKTPDLPMQYGRIQYQLMAMIAQKDLRDDTGKLFTVDTHIWRHCYGKRLTELHVDDLTIAKLMGHSNTGSLKHYRKLGNQQLAEETRQMRAAMDDLLAELVRGWQ